MSTKGNFILDFFNELYITNCPHNQIDDRLKQFL